MGAPRNLNDMVDSLVGDYRTVYGDDLVSVIMHGDAVRNEYRPRKSHIELLVVLTSTDFAVVIRSVEVQKRWRAHRVASPRFMTRSYVGRSLDTFPVEFLDMKNCHRVLYGEDVLVGLEVRREHVRLDCERQLKAAIAEIHRGYVECGGNERVLEGSLRGSLRRLLPVLRALLLLGEEPIPNTDSDVIAAVEDLHKLGVSGLSDVYNAESRQLRKHSTEIAERYALVVEGLVRSVDSVSEEGG